MSDCLLDRKLRLIRYVAAARRLANSEALMRWLFKHHEASAALAGLLMLLVTCGAAAAQEFGGREK